MKIIFTTSDIVGAKLIRWFTGEPASHVAFVFDDKVVIHSSLFGVDIKWFNTYKKHIKIVEQLDIDLRLSTEEKIWQSLMDIRDESEYDYKSILYQGWRRLLKKLFKVPLPDKNEWANPSKDMCVELYATVSKLVPENLPDLGDVSMLSPYELFQQLRAGLVGSKIKTC